MATETVLLRPSATLLSQDATVLTPRVAVSTARPRVTEFLWFALRANQLAPPTEQTRNRICAGS